MAEADDELAGVDEMQQQLDEELAAMYKQLEVRENISGEHLGGRARGCSTSVQALALGC